MWMGGRILQCDSFHEIFAFIQQKNLGIVVIFNYKRTAKWNCSFPSPAKELIKNVTFPHRHTVFSVHTLPRTGVLISP